MEQENFDIIINQFELQEEKEEFKDMENHNNCEYNEVFESINNYDTVVKFDKIITINNIVNDNEGYILKDIVKEFFENDFLQKISKLSRPLDKKYNDVIERKMGRFEIIPPDNILFSIWNILRRNPLFVFINEKIKMEIQKNNPLSNDCIEELGILPIEAHTDDGYWHRDVVINERENVFESKPYYITQIIYLDNLANTEFCIHSNYNRNNNFTKYDKKFIHTDSFSSVVFDGRHLHRGLANSSNDTRYAVYISYYDSSYKRREYGTGLKLY